MLKSWVEAGQDEARFWKLTFRVITAVLDGATARLRHEHNENAWLAWHIEALSRTERMPSLKSMQHQVARPKASSDQNNSKREFDAWSAWVGSRQKG